jgi:5' nucleotidase family
LRLTNEPFLTGAGKPAFYTDDARPFREVCVDSGRVQFNRVARFEKGKVYREGCLKELTRLVDESQQNIHQKNLLHASDSNATESRFNGYAEGAAKPVQGRSSYSDNIMTSNVLYIGDSLFADLVDAKREFGWTTGAVTPEVAYEMDIQTQPDYKLAQTSVSMLLDALRALQDELGTGLRSEHDMNVLDSLERLVSKWRDRETLLLGNPFGSVFRARYQPSLFAHSLRRYCDLYMASVSSLRHYSPQHRFYPEPNFRLLAHEINNFSKLPVMDDCAERPGLQTAIEK